MQRLLFYSAMDFLIWGSEEGDDAFFGGIILLLFAFGIDMLAPNLDHTRKVESTRRPAHVTNVMGTLDS